MELIFISKLGTPSEVLAQLSTFIGIENTQMESVKMYGVEYRSLDEDVETGNSTYEIFDNPPEAQRFAGSVSRPLYIFSADFSRERIFKEDGGWNYDDFSDTFENQEILERFIEPGVTNFGERGN